MSNLNGQRECDSGTWGLVKPHGSLAFTAQVQETGSVISVAPGWLLVTQNHQKGIHWSMVALYEDRKGQVEGQLHAVDGEAHVVSFSWLSAGLQAPVSFG